MPERNERQHKTVGVLIHVTGWALVLCFPLLLNRSGEAFSWSQYLVRTFIPLTFCLVFYLNYFLIIPRYLFRNRRISYLLINLLLIAGVCLGLHLFQTLLAVDRPPVPRGARLIPFWFFLLRDTVSMALVIGLAAAIRLSSQWDRMEEARREAEHSRAQSELRNLRNQINPHFLLNTLNNIYALIAFDPDKAQQAVRELGRLLSYVLYEDRQTDVPLEQETAFLQNYIDLMRIRISDRVSIETTFDTGPDGSVRVAPLLFISLVENAFKHGISPDGSGFIRISIRSDGKTIHCSIANSNHPKTAGDRSGSGIGLEQVSRRLELTYPGRYRWTKGPDPDGKTYRSEITLYL